MKVSVKIPTELSDGTITIRTHKPSDVHPYFEAVRESVAEVSRHLPWCHQDYSIAEAREWIEKMIPRFWEQRSEYHFVITDAITGSVLGGCGLDGINWVNRTANLGYWVRTSRTRQGIATDASRLLARFGFEQLRLKRIDVVTSIENVASARVIEKLNPSEKRGINDNSPLKDGTSNTIMLSLFPQDIL